VAKIGDAGMGNIIIIGELMASGDSAVFSIQFAKIGFQNGFGPRR
jgi:hypothetical protein